MARNQVQFQKGLSTVEFQQLYGTEEQCRAALVRMRWPDEMWGLAASTLALALLRAASACRAATTQLTIARIAAHGPSIIYFLLQARLRLVPTAGRVH